jgi:hypothetical protein
VDYRAFLNALSGTGTAIQRQEKLQSLAAGRVELVGTVEDVTDSYLLVVIHGNPKIVSEFIHFDEKTVPRGQLLSLSSGDQLNMTVKITTRGSLGEFGFRLVSIDGITTRVELERQRARIEVREREEKLQQQKNAEEEADRYARRVAFKMCVRIGLVLATLWLSCALLWRLDMWLTMGGRSH